MAWPMPTHPFLQWVLPSTLLCALALVLAAAVLRRGPRRAEVVLLAAILVIEGAITLVVGWIGYAPIARGSLEEALARTIFPAMSFLPVLYLGLLSRLETPLVAWLKGGRWALFHIPAAALAYLNFHGTGDMWGLAWLVFVPVFAVFASVSAARRAERGSPARARGTAFAVAFITRDVLMVLFLAVLAIGPADVSTGPTWRMYVLVGTNPLALVQLAFLPLLAYGILRTQLFDIDLRIKTGIRAATLTSIFVTVFYVASEATQEFVGGRVGPYIGIAAAGALLVGMRPLQLVATRVAEAAMPGVTGSEAYIRERKLLVYRTAVEAALEDGQLGERERAMLSRIGGELGLDPRAMVAIEDQAFARTRGAPEPSSQG